MSGRVEGTKPAKRLSDEKRDFRKEWCSSRENKQRQNRDIRVHAGYEQATYNSIKITDRFYPYGGVVRHRGPLRPDGGQDQDYVPGDEAGVPVVDQADKAPLV